jgi:predicted oxidoreductase
MPAEADGRVPDRSGQPLPGSARPVTSADSAFLGGCLFSGRQPGPALASALA